MEWSDIGEGIAKVAPTIAGVLAGAGGTLVGGPALGSALNIGAKWAVGQLLDALGLPQDATPTDAAAALNNASPDVLLALKKADQDFAARMRELETADLDSARKRETVVRDNVPRNLAYLVVAGFFIVNIGLLIVFLLGLAAGWDAFTASIVGVIVQGITSAAMAVLMYYFGSSSAATAAASAGAELAERLKAPAGAGEWKIVRK